MKSRNNSYAARVQRAADRAARDMDRFLRGARDRAMMSAGTDPDAAREEAFILKMENDLCLCQDDARIYYSEAEREANEKPAAVCPECNKKRLIVSILANGPVSEGVEAFIVKDILR